MNQNKRLRLLERLTLANPNPVTELNYQSPFELLLAVVLSAQATDKSVNKVTAQLFSIANTPEQVLELGLENLKTYIKTIGLFNSKAAHIITLCQQLLNDYSGEVPKTREQLEKLAGVGRKTANVVLNTAFGQPTIGVDTHIFRVANRTRFATGKDVSKVEDKLNKCVVARYKKNLHHLLILHGRYTCIARNPKCKACIIADLCEYPLKNQV